MRRFVIKSTPRYIVGMTFLLVSTGLDIWFPLITMSIIDDVVIGGDMSKLMPNLICFLIIGIGRALAQYLKEYNFDMAGCEVAEGMRKDLMGHIQKLSKSFFDRNNTGELMARVKDDTGRIWDMTGFVGALLVEAICYFVATLVAMIALSWKLSLVPIIFIPILTVIVLKLDRKLGGMYDQISEENAALNKVIEENISGVRTVKAFAAEDYEIDKFDQKNNRYNELNIEQSVYMAKFEPLLGTIPAIMQTLVLLIGGIAAIRGEITLGVLGAFMQYSSNIVWPLQPLGWMLNNVSAGMASYKKIRKIYDEAPEIVESEAAVDMPDRRGTLSFENVSLKLGDKDILKNVSFELPQGKTLGIMGETGTGKSMIVNLIERFYDVNEGSIRINGIDVRNMKLKDVRGFSSVVTQDIFLFSDTIKENVKLGQKRCMKDDTVRYALRKAHAYEFVEKITGGFEAVIGERGIGLSGGQKQRLSIARALARDAGVLILDDSTSALDMETETDIQKEIREKTDMSKIIIGHRISSVKDADEIIVLEGGLVAERGTHEELLKKKGLYYSTYEAQYGSYKLAMEALGGEA